MATATAAATPTLGKQQSWKGDRGDDSERDSARNGHGEQPLKWSIAAAIQGPDEIRFGK